LWPQLGAAFLAKLLPGEGCGDRESTAFLHCAVVMGLREPLGVAARGSCRTAEAAEALESLRHVLIDHPLLTGGMNNLKATSRAMTGGVTAIHRTPESAGITPVSCHR
jgi:hypothetical protein